MENKSVLLVDDSADFRILVKKALHQENYSVIAQAKNGVVALEKYKELKPDIIITDIDMPKMNGHQLIKEIIELDSNALILAVLTKGSKKDIKHVLELGAKKYINKPFQPHYLFKRLKDMFLEQSIKSKISNKVNNNEDEINTSKNKQENIIIVKNEQDVEKEIIDVENNEDVFIFDDAEEDFLKEQKEIGKKALYDASNEKADSKLDSKEKLNIKKPKDSIHAFKEQRHEIQKEIDFDIHDEMNINELFGDIEKEPKKKKKKVEKIKDTGILNKIKSLFKKGE